MRAEDFEDPSQTRTSFVALAVVLQTIEFPHHKNRDDQPDTLAPPVMPDQFNLSNSPSRTRALVSKTSRGMFMSSHSSCSLIRLSSRSMSSSHRKTRRASTQQARVLGRCSV